MKALANKIGQLRKVIEEQKGPFTLYALVLPEDAIAWDMLVASTWIDKDQPSALKYLVKQVQSVLTKQELLNLSGILLFDTDKLAEYGVSVDSETGWEENNVEFYGRLVQKAYIFVGPLVGFNLEKYKVNG